MMDFDEIRQILDMMREHELAEFELERDNFKLRLRKAPAADAVAGDAAASAGRATPRRCRRRLRRAVRLARRPTCRC